MSIFRGDLKADNLPCSTCALIAQKEFVIGRPPGLVPRMTG